MNFIDISNWQSGIDLAAVFSQNALDGVIVKATQGTGYTNPKFKEWADWLNTNGKPFGVYHYLQGMDAIAEARYFYDTVRPYIGRCVPCADYEEHSAMQKGTAWLKDFLDEFLRLSGVKCLVYCSQSVTQSQNFNDIARAGYQLWMAQYADYSPVYGFLETPWHKGSVAPFNGYVMQQYTSCGVLKGWTAYLDLDKFFGNADDWQALCGEHEAPPAPLKGPDPTVVSEVLMGYYGIGDERAAKLRADGYDPQKVQDKINELYGIAGKIRPIIGDGMDYINSIVKIARTI